MYKTTLRKTDGTEYTVDTYNGLTEQTTTTQSTHAPKEIFYGGVPKTGSMKIDDPQREIVDKVLDGTFDLSDTTVKTYYNDKLQGVFKTSDSDYEENSGELSVSLVDNISNWDKIPFAGRDYSLRADDSIKPDLYEILSYVLMTTLKWDNSNATMQADVDTMCSNTISVNMGASIEDMTVKQYLQRIIIPYDYLEADNLRSTVDKICTVAQLNYAETNGSDGIYPKNIRFFNARPAKAKSEKIIALPPSSQNEFPSRDVLLKNIYSGTIIAGKKVTITNRQNELAYQDDIDILGLSIEQAPTLEMATETAQATIVGNPSYSDLGYAFLKTKYITVNVKVYKNTNNNLKHIFSLHRDSENLPFTQLSGKHFTGTPYVVGDVPRNNLTLSDIEIIGIKEDTFEEELLPNSARYKYSDLTPTSGATPIITVATDTNNNIVSNLPEDKGEYWQFAPINIVVYWELTGLANRESTVGASSPTYSWGGDNPYYEKYEATNVRFGFRGDFYEISFKDDNISINSNSKSVIQVQGSTVLQDKAILVSFYTEVVNPTVSNVSISVENLVQKYGLLIYNDYSFDKYSGKFGYMGNFFAVRGGLSLNTTYYAIPQAGAIDEIVLTSGSYPSGAYTMSITSHITTHTKIEPMTTHIANSVLSDYANGVSTCSVETTLDTLYDTDGNVVKRSNDGEILHIGDVVRVDRNSLGDSVYNYADGNPYLWRVTGTDLIYDGYPHQKLELQEITSGNRGLKYMSWDMIESIANSGQAQNVFSIGDEKEIELSNGEKLTAVIIGFNHDKIIGTKKAGITFMTKTPLQTLYKMSSSGSTDWATSEMKTSTMATIRGMLPKEIYSSDNSVTTKNLLKTVKKEYYSTSGTLSESDDDLFLLSGAEVDGLSKDTFGLEGTQYQYFIDYGKNIGVSYPGWWTRTLKATNTKQYMYRAKASRDFNKASANCYVIFAFCIGEVDA